MLAQSYPWIKALHVFFVMAWMAGIFYLPRIYVHHAEALAAGQDVVRILIMETKLLKFMTVLAVPALATGLYLWIGIGFEGGWLNAKMLFVVALLGYHYACFHFYKDFRRGKIRSGVFYRVFNESILLIFTPIVILAVVKPAL